ncbi:uncharacterized protein At4g06598-like [Diospyros lotus]|uniref:uncharacterized protein At4g06598-like n=1 Tax=Diospyros lotus TaxID=55363 RepID=UPI00225027C7|nr:uncharacterized protein At4g06598-like [Diospyros lotus]
MESLNGRVSSLGTFAVTTRSNAFVPPMGMGSTLMHVSRSYSDFHVLGSRTNHKLIQRQTHHQHSSSETFLLDQPSWLDDLLDDQETLTQPKDHLSTTNSTAYLGPKGRCNVVVGSSSSWGTQNSLCHTDPWQALASSVDKSSNSSENKQNGVTETMSNTVVPSLTPKEPEGFLSTDMNNGDREDSGLSNHEGSVECNCSQSRSSMSKAEAKRAKRQSAQRSRIKKLQYIADLEKNVQVLQAGGSEVSAELEFLDQQKLILGLENKALSLGGHIYYAYYKLESEIFLIGAVEHAILEREIVRLQALHQLQLRQQQQHHHHQQHQRLHQRSKHQRNKTGDLDSQFTNLSLQN